MYPQATVDRALALSRQGLIDREVAQITGVPLSTVRRWRTGRRRVGSSYQRQPQCPRCYGSSLDERAYAYLLGLYLGDGHLSRHPRGVYALSIACSDAWPGLIVAAKRALQEVVPSSSPFGVHRIGMTEIKSYSKHWPCLFPQHGSGRKHLRKIELADWQQVIVDQYPGDFVRGLIHSDGCRITNRVRRTWAGQDHWYEYPRYMFSNESQDIMGLCCAALDQLGVEWRFARRNLLSVAKRDAVRRLDEFVGPKY